jgi:hypothetical protein
MALGKGLKGFSALAVALLVGAPSIAGAHSLLVKPVPRDTTDTLLKMGPCGGSAAAGPLTKKAPVEQYQPGATITVDFKETVAHQGCYLFRLSTTGDDKNFQVLKQVADPAGAGGNQSTTLTLPAGVTCMNCTLQLIQVMLGANCAATQDPTATSNYYSCSDIRIGNFTDAGAIVDAGMPDYDAASTDEPGSSSSGSTTTPTDGGGSTKDEDDDGLGAGPSSRNLQAGKGDDCSIAFGAPAGVSAFVSAGIAVMALLRRRKKS